MIFFITVIYKYIYTKKKINKDNKDNKLVHIEDFDIEKNRIINNVLSLDLNSKDNNDKNEEWVNLENKLIKKEKEIFGDDPFYGFHHLKSLVRSQTLNLNSQSLDMKTMNRKNSYLNNMIVNKEIIIVKNEINICDKCDKNDNLYIDDQLIFDEDENENLEIKIELVKYIEQNEVYHERYFLMFNYIQGETFDYYHYLNIIREKAKELLNTKVKK